MFAFLHLTYKLDRQDIFCLGHDLSEVLEDDKFQCPLSNQQTHVNTC